MPLYEVKTRKLAGVKEVGFGLEKEIQRLVEANLESLFGVSLVKSEMTLNGLRIDTLAYDVESKAFVIIEFKRGQNYSVVDQGMSYLSLMLNNKADFVLEYNNRASHPLKKDGVDWSQSRVMFVAPSFTPYQLGAINFKDLPIELWEIRRYSNGTIYVDQHRPAVASASIKTVSKRDADGGKVAREIKTYTEADHLKKSSAEVVDLYDTFKKRVMDLDPRMTVKPLKKYIAFRATHIVTDVNIQSKRIKVHVNLPKGKLKDPKKIARDVSKVGHWGFGAYEIIMRDDKHLDYLISLVKQSLGFHKKR